MQSQDKSVLSNTASPSLEVSTGLKSHTATPKYKGNANGTVTSSGEIFCKVPTSRLPGQQRQRTELITRACNAHDDLVKALQDLIEFAEPILQKDGFGYMGRFEVARKALAKAGAA